MKKHIRIFTAFLALAGAAFVPQLAKAQIVDYSQGDVLLGFQKAGLSSAPNTVVVNIGQFDLYRDAAVTFTINTIGSNLGSILSSTFGADWNTNPDVYWGVAESWTNGKPSGIGAIAPFNGDPASTFYVGIPEAIIGTQTTGYTINNLTDQQTAAGAMLGMVNTFKTQTASAGTNNKIAVIPTSTVNGWEDYNTHAVPFGSWSVLPQTEGNFGNGTAGTALDLFRQLSSATGNTGEAGTALMGVYEGTFTITDSGVITFNTLPVPEPSTTALLVMGVAGVLVAAFRRSRNRANA